jgi:hypothetical protein
VADLKEKESEPVSDSILEKNKGKQIIDAEPTSTIMITTIQPEELDDTEEGEHLLY